MFARSYLDRMVLKDDFGHLLDTAVSYGNLDEVVSRVEKRPWIARRRRLVYQATEHGHVEIAAFLLDHGASPNQIRESGPRRTPLLTACEKGHLKLVELLLERGADPTIATPTGDTPLTVACVKGDVEVVRCLLCHDATLSDLDHKTKVGTTAVGLACERNHPDVLKLLLEAGADPTEGRAKPINRAKCMGHKECVELLKVGQANEMMRKGLWMI